MEAVLTPEEMHAADRATILDGVAESELMRRAGLAVARAARTMLGGTYGRRVVVIVGGGNNGGDGRIAGAELARCGVGVECFTLGAPLDRRRFVRALERTDLVIDAMFGTGLRRPLVEDAAWVAETVTVAPQVLAVDIPSGVDGLTGAVLGRAVRATRTVTFAARKPGLLIEPGRSHAGRVEVVDIGVDVARGEPDLGLVTDADVVDGYPRRAPDAHKWRAGALVIGGQAGMTGAPMLAARAALRCGAGIVVAAVPGDVGSAVPSEVILRSVPAVDGSVDASAAGGLLDGVERFGAVVIGPGLGRRDGARAVVDRLVAGVTGPIVVDADGLDALALDSGALRVRARDTNRVPAVLTPHAGEYERLAGRPVGVDRVAAARDLAATTGAVVLLKGPGTVIADPHGRRAAIAAAGDARLATAGTGDVLSGLIGALLALGVAPFEAAALGAHLHGRAAEAGPAVGLTAGDLPMLLADVLARLVPTGAGRGGAQPSH